MNVEQYVDAIRDRLFPDPYTSEVDSLPDEFQLLLTHRKLVTARYALGVTCWDRSLEGAAFLASRRRAAARRLGALWTLREVGLFLLVCGPYSEWKDHVADMPADKMGLRAVIVQAVYFVDLESGENHLNQSAWGPVRFGGVDSVASVIDSISTGPV